MKIYSHYGFNEFILCLGYKSEVIKDYFYNYEARNNDFTIKLGMCKSLTMHDNSQIEDWTVTLVDTGLETLKGGRLKRIEKYIDGDDFVLTYGDGVANIDIKQLMEYHRSHGRIGTVSGVHPPSLFGELAVRDGKALIFTEKPQTTKGLINGGFFVFRREIFNYLTEDASCDFEKGPLEKLAGQGQLMVYRHEGDWACMDTLRDNEYLNSLWEENNAFWKVW